MYTGITQGLFKVTFVEKQHDLTTYRVQLNEELARGLKKGDSVSIDGVCQTVVALEGCEVTFQAILETLSKTTLCHLHQGQQVSVERSARIGDENGGHEMAGHIFEVGTIVERKDFENSTTLTIRCSASCIDFVFEKGFVGVDGCSLTVGHVDREKKMFQLHLIPETLQRTNFSQKKINDGVNIERDAKAVIIVETLRRFVEPLEQRIAALEKI